MRGLLSKLEVGTGLETAVARLCSWRLRACALFFAFFWVVLSARGADETPACAVCEGPLTESFYWISGPGLAERQRVCADCSNLPAKCFVCGLPVKANGRKLEDGRVLCRQDAPVAVFDLSDARHIFAEAKRDMFRIFSGSGILPDRNIELALVDRAKMEVLHRTKGSTHDERMTMGLTQTRQREDGGLDHTIYLLNGLGRGRLASVCAHEWAHSWLHENVPAERKLDDDTVEGFCELAAYKMALERNESLEAKFILENPYTRGQVHALIKAEGDQNFWRIIQWAKTGVDSSIAATNTARVIVRKAEPTPAVVWQPSARTPVPNKLTLRGLSGTSRRRFALVNDSTLEPGQQARVRVGQTNVVVRCLEISERSVLLQLRGTEERVELFLARD